MGRDKANSAFGPLPVPVRALGVGFSVRETQRKPVPGGYAFFFFSLLAAAEPSEGMHLDFVSTYFANPLEPYTTLLLIIN